MITPKISFCLPTMRPGGFDLLGISFGWQTCKDYELVVADSFPGRVDRGVARRYLESKGVNVGWHGIVPPNDRPLNFAAAMNAAALHARAERIVFIHDYTLLPPDATAAWLRSFAENGTRALISGVGQVAEVLPPEIPDDDVSVWHCADVALEGLGKNPREWVPEVWEIFYAGMPVSYLEECNGFDERGDGFIGWPLESVFVQARKHSYRFVVDRRLVCGLAEHHKWKGPSGIWDAAERGSPEDEPGWLMWSPNSWVFHDERQKILEGGK